jgi:hypothetical protein
MNRKVLSAAAAAGLVLAIASLAGCWGVWGARQGDVKPSTAEFRNELELVPSAKLTKEDTSPDWPLGREAFVRGDDRLLVISRITSWARPREDEKAPIVRDDHILERVWVTVPAGTPLGKQLKVEDLLDRFLVGYDVGLIGQGIYIEPYRALGTVTLIEEKPNMVIANVDVVVEPQRHPSWRVRGVYEVPVSTTGIRATTVTPPPYVRLAAATQPSMTADPMPTTQPATKPAK